MSGHTAGGFTPGPWQIENDYVPGCLTIIANVDGEIIDGTTHHTFDFIAQCVDDCGEFSADAAGNARLIAAAPAMLEALQRLVGEEIGGDARAPRNNHESYSTFITWSDRAFARLAIASATQGAGV